VPRTGYPAGGNFFFLWELYIDVLFVVCLFVCDDMVRSCCESVKLGDVSHSRKLMHNFSLQNITKHIILMS
jgi:hypothetical protein